MLHILLVPKKTVFCLKSALWEIILRETMLGEDPLTMYI